MRKKNLWRKTASVIIAAAMIMTSVPVYAEVIDVPVEDGIVVEETTGTGEEGTSGGEETEATEDSAVHVKDENGIRNAISGVALDNSVEKEIILDQNIELSSQVTIDRPNITINGNGNTISVASSASAWSTDNSSKYMLLITGSNVKIENITLDGTQQNQSVNVRGGIQFYKATGGVISNITLNNFAQLGLNINASKVTATGILSQENIGWNGINVSYGSGISDAGDCTFDCSGATISGVEAIYTDISDKDNAGEKNISITTPSSGWADLTVAGKSHFYVPSKAKIDKVEYGSLESAIEAADSGATIQVLKNIDVSTTISIDKNLIINLNGNTITGKDASDSGVRVFNIVGGNVTLTGNGTVQVINSGIKAASSVIRVGDNSTEESPSLTIDKDVTISTNQCYGVTVFGSKTTESLLVKGKIATTDVPAISGNGSVGYGGTTITLEKGSEVTTTNDYAIYHPQSGTLNINGEVTGKGGIEAKAGNTNVSVGENASITATATEQSHTENNNGTSTQGFAIAVVENNNYAGGAKVSIAGGTVIGKMIILADNEVEAGKEGSISISGGTFSSDPTTYLASGCYAHQGSNNWGVSTTDGHDYNYNVNGYTHYCICGDSVYIPPYTPPQPTTPPATTDTVTNPDGSTTSTTTQENTDGSTTTTVVDKDTNGNVTGTTETVEKTEGNTTTKTETTTAADGSQTVTESTLVKNEDGSSKETATITASDGSVANVTTTTAADGSATEVKETTETNSAGKEVEITTTTTTDTKGEVTGVTEKSDIKNVAENTTATVTVRKDGDDNVKTSRATVVKTVDEDTTKVTLAGAVVDQIEAASGTSNVTVTLAVKNEEDDTKYTVKVATKNLEAGNKLYVYKVNPQTGERTMVNDKLYTVSADGSITFNTKQNADFVLVNKASAAATNKAIKKTLTPAKTSSSIKEGKTTKMKLNSALNMENVKNITYSTTKSSVAKVSSNGTITAKKAGTAYITATITLKNGYKKTVRMKVTVKE